VLSVFLLWWLEILLKNFFDRLISGAGVIIIFTLPQIGSPHLVPFKYFCLIRDRRKQVLS